MVIDPEIVMSKCMSGIKNQKEKGGQVGNALLYSIGIEWTSNIE